MPARSTRLFWRAICRTNSCTSSYTDTLQQKSAQSIFGAFIHPQSYLTHRSVSLSCYYAIAGNIIEKKDRHYCPRNFSRAAYDWQYYVFLHEYYVINDFSTAPMAARDSPFLCNKSGQYYVIKWNFAAQLSSRIWQYIINKRKIDSKMKKWNFVLILSSCEKIVTYRTRRQERKILDNYTHISKSKKN